MGSAVAHVVSHIQYMAAGNRKQSLYLRSDQRGLPYGRPVLLCIACSEGEYKDKKRSVFREPGCYNGGVDRSM
jgi:hypothetical protein